MARKGADNYSPTNNPCRLTTFERGCLDEQMDNKRVDMFVNPNTVLGLNGIDMPRQKKIPGSNLSYYSCGHNDRNPHAGTDHGEAARRRTRGEK